MARQEEDQTIQDPPQLEVNKTRSGRSLRKPPRYMSIDSSKVLSGKEGEVVRTQRDHGPVT